MQEHRKSLPDMFDSARKENISQICQIKKLSDTRWTCRKNAITAICCTYDSLLATLEEISDGRERSKAFEADCLLNKVNSFSFIIQLIIFDRLLNYTKSLMGVILAADSPCRT